MKKYILVALVGIVFSTLTSPVFANLFDGKDSTGTIIKGSSNITVGPSTVNPSNTTSSFTSNDITSANAGSQQASSSSGSCHVPTDIGSLFTYVLCVLDSSVVPFLIGLGLILFLTGVLKFVSSGDNEEARQGGRNMMLFGIISLFVMVSIWGFVNILSKSFFGTDSEIQSLPRKSTSIFKQ